MKFRKIEIGDRAVFLELCTEFFASPAVLHSVPAECLERNFAAMVDDNPFAEGWIFEDDGKAAGYCFLAKSYSGEAGGICLWIEELFVLPEYRSQGTGGAFLRFLRERYQGKIARIRLEVTPENRRALELYQRNGFEELPYIQMVCDLL